MVYLIAGHNLTNDSGAIGVGGIKEADLTVKVRDLVHKRIKEIDPKFFVTKDDDRDSLAKVISKIRPRIQIGDLIIDIHFNAGVSTATGFEVVISDNAGATSLKVAEELCAVLPNIMGVKNRGIKQEKDTPRKKLGILNLKGSAVIIELAFITNQSDLQHFEENLHWLCEEIALIAIKYGK